MNKLNFLYFLQEPLKLANQQTIHSMINTNTRVGLRSSTQTSKFNNLHPVLFNLGYAAAINASLKRDNKKDHNQKLNASALLEICLSLLIR